MKNLPVFQWNQFAELLVMAVGVSAMITMVLGWNFQLFSTILSVCGFVVLGFSFFSGWGHSRMSENANMGMTEVLRKEEDKMQGEISISGIAASALLIGVGTLIYFVG